MDTLRIRRAIEWLTGTAPRSGVRFSGRFRVIPLEILVALWGLLIAALTLTLHTVADAWWPATILLFLGRWPWLLPAVPLLAASLALRQWRAALLAVCVTVVGLIGVMELSLGVQRAFSSGNPDSRVRVITYNIDGDAVPPSLFVAIVMEWQPDVLAIQECGQNAREQLSRIAGYVSDVGGTCLLTRFPIIRVDSLRRDNFMAAGGAAWVKRYRLKGPVGEFDFTNLHLDTPRKAFEALMTGSDDATGTITYKTDVRDLESKLARRWVDQGRGPRVVAGDFNMPTESAIFRRHWASMDDAFEAAGFGFGYTRLAGWIRLRIDHVLVDDGWVVRSAQVLPDYGSDHLPVMVDIERSR